MPLNTQLLIMRCRWLCGLVVPLLFGCHRDSQSRASVDAGLPSSSRCDAGNSCKHGDACIGGVCIPGDGICQTSDDCQGDTYCFCGEGLSGCQDGICVPWGLRAPPFSSQCPQPPLFDIAGLRLEEKCSWRGGTVNPTLCSLR